MKIRSISTLKIVIRSIKVSAQAENQIRRHFQKSRNQFRKSSFFFSIFMMTIIKNYHNFDRRKNRHNTRSNHERQLFDDIHE